MRIAMIGQKGIPAMYGGIERHVEELALALARKGHEVTVYARTWYTPKTIKNYKGITVVHIPTIHTKHLDAITHTFLSTLHALWKGADIVHYHGVGPALVSWLPRLFSRKTKVVATFHTLDRYHQKWGWFARRMLHLGEWTVCAFPYKTISVSKTIYNYCINEYQKLTTYIPNGISKATMNGSSLIEDAWNLKPEKYFLMVSRLVRHKGAHYLIRAWQIAQQQRSDILNQYKLVIVGDSAFTDTYVKSLKEMARGDRSIIFTGWQNGAMLSQLYANTKLFIHPSENEGLPITVLQSMSYARPILVSDIPEHKELILDSRFWFENANITSLAAQMIKLMQDENVLKEAGEQNKHMAEKHYNWEDIVNQTIAVYQEEGSVVNYQPIKI